MNRGWFVCRDFPVLRKSAEMIEADIVKIVRDPTHPLDPPGIALRLHHVPAIKRMAPALAVCTEKIWGHAGDDLGIEVGVQTKQIGVGPDIGAVKIYKDRDVAHNANRTLRAVGAERLPLFEEEKPHDAADIEIVEHFRVRLLDRHRITMSEFAGPVVPPFQLETRAQTIEENEVIEPPLVLPAEVLISGAGIRCSGAHEVARRFEQKWQLLAEDRRVIHGLDAIG